MSPCRIRVRYVSDTYRIRIQHVYIYVSDFSDTCQIRVYICRYVSDTYLHIRVGYVLDTCWIRVSKLEHL